MLRPLWKFIRDGKNREIISWVGGGVVVIVPAIWAAFNYFFSHADHQPAAAPTPAITQSVQSGRDTVINAPVSGRDTVINAPVAFGLDEQQVQLRIAAAQKPLTDQFEKLAAQVAREKGVEVAPLRAILIKLGEAGVADQDVAKSLDEKADELIKLREEIAQLRGGGPQVASLAQTAQALLDNGDLDSTRAILAFVDHFRRTGDSVSKLAELPRETDLMAAAGNFMARGDNAKAARTMNALGDIHRFQQRWEPALYAYRMAETFARQTTDRALLAKALKWQAQIEADQRDYDKARAHVEEALGVSRGLADKKQEGDALLVLAEIQVKQADLTGAADSINRVMIIADERDDDELRFYALFDRPDIWMKSCDVAIPSSPSELPAVIAAFRDCLHKIDLTVRDYTQAREIARRQGWVGLAREMDAFIKRAEMRAQLVRSVIDLQSR
jgi:tetratricopeptide (TPR) repeat protein